MAAIDVFNIYNDALSKGDFATAFTALSDDVVWHQPGSHQFAGTFTGLEAVQAHLGQLAGETAGSLVLATEWAAATDNMVTASVHFTAKRGNKSIDMMEIDAFRVEGDKIVEVWLVDQDIALENDFWA
jgi:ketosteroid isomerase-like protein